MVACAVDELNSKYRECFFHHWTGG